MSNLNENSKEKSPNIGKKELNRKHHELAKYGNYWNYYFHRTQTIPDARLSLLPSDLFSDRRILDLGCNAGKLSVESITHLNGDFALGIDIDQHLVDEASKLITPETTHKLEFQCADFMQNSRDFFVRLVAEQGTFDTILLLSITKWLHLHHLDEGMILLFNALYEVLPSGGTLVVEPQEWENYQSAKKKNKNLRENFVKLQLRPPFTKELEHIGFVLVKNIERDEGGFSRPLMIWQK